LLLPAGYELATVPSALPAVLPEPYAFCPVVANALSTVPTLTFEFSTES